MMTMAAAEIEAAAATEKLVAKAGGNCKAAAERHRHNQLKKAMATAMATATAAAKAMVPAGGGGSGVDNDTTIAATAGNDVGGNDDMDDGRGWGDGMPSTGKV